MMTDPHVLLLDPRDNVVVVRRRIRAGTRIEIDTRTVGVAEDMALGHKLARRPIAPDEKIVKYGVSIGRATAAIAPGDHVHVHNVASDYTPTHWLSDSVAGRKETA